MFWITLTQDIILQVPFHKRRSWEIFAGGKSTLIVEKYSVSETPCTFRRYNAENRDVRAGVADIYVVRNCREAVFRDRYTAACPNRNRPVIGNRANYLVRKVLKQMSRSYIVIQVSRSRLVSPGDHNSYDISLGSLSSSAAAATRCAKLLFDL